MTIITYTQDLSGTPPPPLVQRGQPLQVSFWKPWQLALHPMLSVPIGQCALVALPNGRYHVVQQGDRQRVILPLGVFQVFFVDMQKRAIGPLTFEGMSADHWRVSLVVVVRYHVNNPQTLLREQNPEQAIRTACDVAVADLICTSAHDELVVSPDAAPVESVMLSSRILQKLAGKLPGGIVVDKIEIIRRAGDPHKIELNNERNRETARCRSQRESLRERMNLEEAKLQSQTRLATLETTLGVMQAKKKEADVLKAKYEAEARRQAVSVTRQDIELENLRKLQDQDYQLRLMASKQFEWFWKSLASHLAVSTNSPGMFGNGSSESLEAAIRLFMAQGSGNFPGGANGEGPAHGPAQQPGTEGSNREGFNNDGRPPTYPN